MRNTTLGIDKLFTEAKVRLQYVSADNGKRESLGRCLIVPLGSVGDERGDRSARRMHGRMEA